ncbi:MAG TPA: hypothetical protein VKU02_28570 [Gemmataceae bacterium]|nr:hypothetical protein [Gemmataceae bacterium]
MSEQMHPGKEGVPPSLPQRADELGLRFVITATLLAVCTSASPAFDVVATIQKVDSDQGIIVFKAGQQARTLRVPPGVRILDAAGQELRNGLKAKELKEGTAVTLTVERDAGKPVLKAIQLRKGATGHPAAQSGKVQQQDTSALIPLTDLGTKEYKGFPGGLYPGGKNTRPAGHEAAGIELARHVQPLDADGKPNPDGKIVLLGIGFSNTVQAFNGFMAVAREDNDLNPKLVLVNGDKGGRAAFMIQNPDDGRQGTDYWDDVDKKLRGGNVTRQQVQVVWIKETNPNPPDPGFPKFTQDLQAQLGNIVRLVQQRFPNVKLAYFSSRTYGGWAQRPGGGPPGNSEPFSYETGFAVKWLIEQQLSGEPALNYDATKGPVRAPWLSWSAYLWSNGPIQRGDGVSFELEDFMATDHMHESPAGQRKVGRLLLQFFKTDSTTRPWFVKPQG